MRKDHIDRENDLTMKAIILMAGGLFGLALVFAQDTVAECLKGDCLNGIGVYQVSDGRVYEGSFSRGIISGKGILRFPDGTIYEGAFDNGKFNGKGVLKSSDGKVYNGQFSNGVINGQGVLSFPDKSQYRG